MGDCPTLLWSEVPTVLWGLFLFLEHCFGNAHIGPRFAVYSSLCLAIEYMANHPVMQAQLGHDHGALGDLSRQVPKGDYSSWSAGYYHHSWPYINLYFPEQGPRTRQNSSPLVQLTKGMILLRMAL